MVHGATSRSATTSDRRRAVVVPDRARSSPSEKRSSGTGIEPDQFWEQLASLLAELAPENATLLERRHLHTAIDEWHHTPRVSHTMLRPTARS